MRLGRHFMGQLIDRSLVTERYNDRTDIVTSFLVVNLVRTVTHWKRFRLPAAAQDSLLSLHISLGYFVDHLWLVLTNRLIYRTSPGGNRPPCRGLRTCDSKLHVLHASSLKIYVGSSEHY